MAHCSPPVRPGETASAGRRRAAVVGTVVLGAVAVVGTAVVGTAVVRVGAVAARGWCLAVEVAVRPVAVPGSGADWAEATGPREGAAG